MAGDWIKMTTELHEKPEVEALSKRLNIDPFAVVGRLHRVWSWFSSHTHAGNAAGVTPDFIDRLVTHEGFAAGMTAVGWLALRNGQLSVPNFDRHNSKSAKTRALGHDRMKRLRCATSVTKTSLEKRREEKKKESGVPDSSPPAVADGTAARPRDELWDEVAAIWFPGKLAKPERSRIGAVLKILREHDAKPQEIREHIVRYRREWPDAECSAEAIAKHWKRFSSDEDQLGTEPSAIRREIERLKRETNDANMARKP